MKEMSNGLLIEVVDDTMLITFNRPEIRSPLSVNVVEELQRRVDGVSAANVKKVVFTGQDGVFASGADLREIAKVTGETAREFALRGQRLMNGIAEIEALTIAAVDGFCFGGALDLALACNVRIASRRSLFSHPGASLGIITGWGGTQRLPRLVGQANALEMFFLAKRIEAEVALTTGLVDYIADDPLEAALEYAADEKAVV